ncbi:hypothetical protein MCEMRE195_01158 [Candidatus Nanopelagicaceae bacterium]
MSDIDPLIKREMQWMALGVYENRDLAPMIIAKVRRRRIRNAIVSIVGVLAIAGVSIGVYEVLIRKEPVQIVGGVTGNNMSNQPEILGLSSDYPVTWEQSVGDIAAISSAGGLGDTLGGLTAVGLKISWERCGKVQCPITWILSVENQTNDVISTSPSLGIFNGHTPLVSDSRPTTVLPGGRALLVYTFPEFKESLKIAPNATWQWNWYLAQLR